MALEVQEPHVDASPQRLVDLALHALRAALATATTCASFGTLVLSGHAGLASMGLVMLVALPVCWLASCSTLPAAARIRRQVPQKVR